MKTHTKANFMAVLRLLPAFLAYALGQTALYTIQILGTGLGLPPLMGTLAGTIAATALFTLLLWLYIRFAEKRRFADIGLVKPGRGALWRFAAGLAIGLVCMGATVLPLYLTGQYTLSAGTGGGEGILLLAEGLVFYFYIGYGEEIMTRGALQHGLLFTGPLPALIISSVLFSLLHFFNPEFSLMAFINIILAGLILGLSLYAFGDLWAPIGFHLTWNWAQGYVLGIPVSGTTRSGFFRTDIAGRNVLLTGGEFGAEGTLSCSVVLAVGCVILFLIAKKNGQWARFAALGRKAKNGTDAPTA